MAQHVSGAGRRCRFGDGGGGLRPARRIPRHRPGRRRAPPLFRRPGAADRRRCPPLTAPQAAHRRPLQSPAAASVLLGFFPPLKFTVSCFFFLSGCPFHRVVAGCAVTIQIAPASSMIFWEVPSLKNPTNSTVRSPFQGMIQLRPNIPFF